MQPLSLATRQQAPRLSTCSSFPHVHRSLVGDSALAKAGEFDDCTCKDSWDSDVLVPCRVHDDCWSNFTLAALPAVVSAEQLRAI